MREEEEELPDLDLADALDKISPQTQPPRQVQEEDLGLPDEAFGAEYGNGRHYRLAVCCSSWTVAHESWNDSDVGTLNFPGLPALVLYDLRTWGSKSNKLAERRTGPTSIWTPGLFQRPSALWKKP